MQETAFLVQNVLRVRSLTRGCAELSARTPLACCPRPAPAHPNRHSALSTPQVCEEPPWRTAFQPRRSILSPVLSVPRRAVTPAVPVGSLVRGAQDARGAVVQGWYLVSGSRSLDTDLSPDPSLSLDPDLLRVPPT
eukprot:1234280-Rhodomonas_salina.1